MRPHRASRCLPPARRNFYRRARYAAAAAYYINLLFSLALAVYRRGWSRALVWDLAAHLTLTQQLFPQSYIGTQLNGVTWTLTVFALFYLVFPAAGAAVRPPPAAGAGMALHRAGHLHQWALPQYGSNAYALLFNQFPAFCGVLAVGMAAALIFAQLGRGAWTQRLAPAWAARCSVWWRWSGWMPCCVRRPVRRSSSASSSPRCGGELCRFRFRPPRRPARPPAYLPPPQILLIINSLPNQLGNTAWMQCADRLYWAAAILVSVAMYFPCGKAVCGAAKQNCKKCTLEKPAESQFRTVGACILRGNVVYS